MKILVLFLFIFTLSCSESPGDKPSWFTGQCVGNIGFEHDTIDVDIRIEFRDDDALFFMNNRNDSIILEIDTLAKTYAGLTFSNQTDVLNPYKFRYMIITELDTINMLYVQCFSSNEDMKLWFGEIGKY